MDTRQFFSFILAGGIAGIVNFLSRIFYNQYINFSSSIIFAYITGMITAFTLSKKFVFKDSKQTMHNSIIYFIAINILAISQTYFLSILIACYIFPFLEIDYMKNEISHSIGIVFPIFTSYFGHKHFSFK